MSAQTETAAPSTSTPEPDHTHGGTMGRWVALEIMGHRRHVGVMRETTVGGAAFIEIHVPIVSEVDGTARVTDWQIYTYAPAAVFGFHPTTQELAIKAATPWTLRSAALPDLSDDTTDDDSLDD